MLMDHLILDPMILEEIMKKIIIMIIKIVAIVIVDQIQERTVDSPENNKIYIVIMITIEPISFLQFLPLWNLNISLYLMQLKNVNK